MSKHESATAADSDLEQNGCGVVVFGWPANTPLPSPHDCRLCRAWVFLHGISGARSNGRRPKSPTAPPAPQLASTLLRHLAPISDNGHR
jgi:hypothetical protein